MRTDAFPNFWATRPETLIHQLAGRKRFSVSVRPVPTTRNEVCHSSSSTTLATLPSGG